MWYHLERAHPNLYQQLTGAPSKYKRQRVGTGQQSTVKDLLQSFHNVQRRDFYAPGRIKGYKALLAMVVFDLAPFTVVFNRGVGMGYK